MLYMKNDVQKEISNFKEYIERIKKFKKNIAFKYKENDQIKEITYEQYINDIKQQPEK